MPITLDTALAGMQPLQAFLKAGSAMEAVGVPHSFWYTAGRPGAATANAAGVNGQGVTGNSIAGQIPRGNPSAPERAYLARLAVTASLAGTLLLIDRLWENSGLSTTSTSAQAITAATIPSRDLNGSNNGEGILAAIEWSAAGGAGTPTVTLTYTDQSGNTGATGSFVGNTTPNAGTFEIFQLAAGDTGIRTPTSFIQSATRTSGTMHLVLFRILAQVECTAPGLGNAVDFLTGGRPLLYDGTVPQLVWIPNSATATNVFGTYQETFIDPA